MSKHNRSNDSQRSTTAAAPPPPRYSVHFGLPVRLADRVVPDYVGTDVEVTSSEIVIGSAVHVPITNVRSWRVLP